MKGVADEPTSSVVAGTRWNLVGQGAALGVGFTTAVVTARVLGPASRGEFAVLATVANLIAVCLAFGLPIAIGYYASRGTIEMPRLITASVGIAVLIGVATITTGTMAGGELVKFVDNTTRLTWLLLAVLVPLYFIEWCCGNALLGRLRFRRYNFALVSARLAVLAVTVVLGGILALGVSGCLIALIAGEVIFVSAAASRVVRQWRLSRPDAKTARLLLRFGVRVQVGAIFQLLNYRFDVLILQFFRPLREVGFYVVAQVMAELVLAVGRAFQAAVMPGVAASRTPEAQARATLDGARGHSFAALAASVGVGAMSPAIIYLGYGATFAPAIVPTLILLPAMWFLGTGNVVTSDLRGRGRPGITSVLSGAAVVATVVLDFALIPPFGMYGAASASVIAYAVYGIAALLVLRAESGYGIRELSVPTAMEVRYYGGWLRRVISGGSLGNRRATAAQ